MAFLTNRLKRDFPSSLQKTRRVFRWVLGAFLLAMVIGPFENPGPCAGADELTDLHQEIESIQTRLKLLHQEEEILHNREAQLSERIRQLKEEARKGTSLLLEMRMEASLRDFRDLLLSIKRVEAQEHAMEDQLSVKKSRLREVLSRRIDDQVKVARDLYRKGQEKEADEAYLAGLKLMEEYKALSTIQIEEDAILDHMNTLELPPIAQAEPEQLKELADLMLDDAELLAMEVGRYTKIQERLHQEKRLLDQLMGFQGVIERGQPSDNHKAQEIQREQQNLERKLHLIKKKIATYQARGKMLADRAKELIKIAEEKEQSSTKSRKER